MAIGLVGTLVPILPGLLFMWGGAVLYSLASGFDSMAIWFLAAVSVVILGAIWLGLRLPQRQTTDAGVGTGVQMMAVAAAAVGFFVIPVVGAGVGFVFAIFLFQLSKTKEAGTAWESTKAALVGLAQAAAAQFGAGVVVFLIWVVWVLVD